MAFTNTGDIQVVITNVLISNSKLVPKHNSFDVCIEVKTADGLQGDWWRGNLSSDLTRLTNKAGMTNAQVTLEKLNQLGFQGVDLNTLHQQLVGRETIAHVEEKNGYKNIKYLGGGSYTPEAISANDMAAVAALITNSPQPQQQAGFGQPQPQQQAGFGQPQQQAGFGQ